MNVDAGSSAYAVDLAALAQALQVLGEDGAHCAELLAWVEARVERLHARWSGLAKVRGVALLCVAGAMVTVWSWFGTNQLQVGLHSYGFSTELALLCRYIWLGLLVVVGVGLIPQRFWASFKTPPPAVAPPTGKRPKAAAVR